MGILPTNDTHGRTLRGHRLIKIFAVLALAVALAGTTTATRACPKPADPIAIQSVHISENPIRAGSHVEGTVIATCNVAAVTAQVGTFRVGLAKRSPGVFHTAVDVPHLVWPGHFKLVVTAIRTDGATVSTTLPIEVRW